VLHAPGGLVRRVANRRKRAQRGPGRILGRLVSWREAEVTEVLRDPADRGRVAPAVVVEDDHHLRLQLADVVERLIRHAAGERTVADDDDDLAGLAAQLAG